MGWLAAHDILPALTAGDPPRIQASDWGGTGARESQFEIQLDRERIGTLWTTYRIDELSVQREDIVWIESFPLPIYPLKITMNSIFTPDGLLDEFSLLIPSRTGRRVELHGERFHADFSFTLEIGAHEQAFKVPLSDGSLITGGFNPFNRLANIKVGQTWRVQVFNPVAVLTNMGPRFLSILVRVTGRERLVIKGTTHDCLVVEAPNARAWVDMRGDVVMQEMVLPISGALRLLREPVFDREAREAVWRQ